MGFCPIPSPPSSVSAVQVFMSMSKSSLSPSLSCSRILLSLFLEFLSRALVEFLVDVLRDGLVVDLLQVFVLAPAAAPIFSAQHSSTLRRFSFHVWTKLIQS